MLQSKKLWNGERLDLLYWKLREILHSNLEESLKLEILDGLDCFVRVTSRRKDAIGGKDSDLFSDWMKRHWELLGAEFEKGTQQNVLFSLTQTASTLATQYYRFVAVFIN